MNYIGSKLSLLGEIEAILRRHQALPDQLIANGVAAPVLFDAFSGTAIVAQWGRLQGFTVVANDWQFYSFYTQQAFLETQGYPAFDALFRQVPALAKAEAHLPRPTFGLASDPGFALETLPLRRVLAHLEALPGRQGPFYQAYCEGGSAGRMYFSAINGAACEAIRDTIAAWHQAGWLKPPEHALLVASLLETMDSLANTASVYGAYLKKVKKSATAPVVLRFPKLPPADGLPHRAHRNDALTLTSALGPLDLLYIDPPYNHRQYGSNYHVLETIACWDLVDFKPRGVTGLRPDFGQRSPFCSKPRVAQAFAQILAPTARRALVSYNHEGLLPEAALKDLLAGFARNNGTTDFHEIVYKRFRAEKDHEKRRYKGDAVREFLFYASRV